MLCDSDNPIPILPGLFAALPRLRFVPKLYWKKHFKTAFYFADHNPLIMVLRKGFTIEPKYLFSFTGSETSKVRKRIFDLTIKRGDVLIRKTSNASFWENFRLITGVKKTTATQDYLAEYANEILQSKFVLCPRGNGISSYRLFEVMEAGRVPVVISDNYMFPDIPYDWKDLVLRVSENEVEKIEAIIAANEKRFREMAELNLEVYEKYFSNKWAYIETCLRELHLTSQLKNNFHYLIFRLLWTTQINFYFSAKRKAVKFIISLKNFSKGQWKTGLK